MLVLQLSHYQYGRAIMIGRCVGVNEVVPVVILAGVILIKQLPRRSVFHARS